MEKLLRINSFIFNREYSNHISETTFLNMHKQKAVIFYRKEINNVKIIKENLHFGM